MKLYLICGFFCCVGFFAMAMQLGLFGNQPGGESTETAAEGEAENAEGEPKPVPEKKQAPTKKLIKNRAKFPQELAPAAKAIPVPIAAAYVASDRPHKMAFFKATGDVHPWQETHAKNHDEWYTPFVEDTELVVVVGGSLKVRVSYHTYPDGALPVSRYQYDLEASIVEAKTGVVLANRLFRNIPRPLLPIEKWELTAIGAPVSYFTVFRWAESIAKTGAPQYPTPTPILTTIE